MNYHLPKLSIVFTDPYCAVVSNEHCLLTLFYSMLLSYSNNKLTFVKNGNLLFEYDSSMQILVK